MGGPYLLHVVSRLGGGGLSHLNKRLPGVRLLLSEEKGPALLHLGRFLRQDTAQEVLPVVQEPGGQACDTTLGLQRYTDLLTSFDGGYIHQSCLSYRGIH